MSEQAIIEKLDALTAAVVALARLAGVRLTRAEVCERLGIHRNTLPAYITDKGFPTPMRCGTWSLAEVLEWQMARLDAGEASCCDDPEQVELAKGAFHLYRHFDRDGALLYVGVSISALNRLAAHREDAPWFWRIARIEVQAYATREASLIAERRAIQRERPQFNIQHSERAA
jgi:predicted DNA-binding transcriptional regulator AlpA